MKKETILKIIKNNRPEFAAAQLFTEFEKEKYSLESFAKWCISDKFDSRNIDIFARQALINKATILDKKGKIIGLQG